MLTYHKTTEDEKYAITAWNYTGDYAIYNSTPYEEQKQAQRGFAGCIPPNSAPIYIASGISGLNEPSRIFKNLLFHYALPVVLIAILIMLGIFPVVGA